MIIFQLNFRSDKCSERTAPYNKCLEFTAPTELRIIRDDAPAENNCKKTIWLAPLKIIIEVAYVRYGPKPNSMPIAPKIIPKGITGIIKGNISIIP